MAAIADVNGDGAADVIVPARGYREVAVVTFAGGPRELGRVRHAARVVTNIVVGLVSGKRAAVYGLSDGTIAVLPAARRAIAAAVWRKALTRGRSLGAMPPDPPLVSGHPPIPSATLQRSGPEAFNPDTAPW